MIAATVEASSSAGGERERPGTCRRLLGHARRSLCFPGRIGESVEAPYPHAAKLEARVLRVRDARGLPRGSRKAQGACRIPVSNQRPETFVLTESAFDALSSFGLEPTPEGATVFASTAGAAPNLSKWIEAWKPTRNLCAFDANTAGDQNADAIANAIQKSNDADRKAPASGTKSSAKNLEQQNAGKTMKESEQHDIPDRDRAQR